VTRPEREYLNMVAALAEMPELIARLLDQHNPTGLCQGCTTRGGRMRISAPCAPRQLALAAQRARAERGDTGTS